ncbi:hypothetical protein LTR70_003088 [Exophiala xenobiotica]|uniref:Myb-like DNA-binding domain-containing protein n=1 Tax=Lithohypha guttulata TaxID=1690604 RepID=A0ABR0KHG3_9EURO|nr:hypothetical protein LTR24_002679 [Lithohypha guttulata]KAK5323799.1 hypothetical protein LTR70_003088 [Exophiala xenobiotica]
MAKRMNADDQFKFLLCCVKWSNNGKVDFTEVARECGVVSKAAAAKRYERMLKAHGIHPHGGPLEATAISGERGTYGAKTSKKRKLEETSPFMHHTEIEEQKYQIPQRLPRAPYVKQEPLPMGYQPYMHRQMMSHQPPFMQQQMPHFMPQRMGHVPYSARTPPPYQMMPGMPHDNSLMIPPLSMNQALPPFNHEQDQHTLNSFDGYYNSDFNNCESFENLLSGSSDGTNDIRGNAETQSPLAKLEQTDATLQKGASTPIKSEPNAPTQCTQPDIQPKDGEPGLIEVGAMASLPSPCQNQPSMTATALPGKGPITTFEDLKPVKSERCESFVLLSP